MRSGSCTFLYFTDVGRYELEVLYGSMMVGFSRARWIHVLYGIPLSSMVKVKITNIEIIVTFSFSQRIGRSFLGDLRSDHFTEKMIRSSITLHFPIKMFTHSSSQLVYLIFLM